MGLYTRTGDSGDTGLFGGSRVRKDDPRVWAYGEADELNAWVGVAIASANERLPACEAIRERLTAIQNELFSLGAELATPPETAGQPKTPTVSAAMCKRLESWIDEASAAVEPLRAFVLPGGDELAARLHVCRTVCRRAERAIVTLARASDVRPDVLIYVNRLSDLFFAWARLANRLAGVDDVPWAAPAS